MSLFCLVEQRHLDFSVVVGFAELSDHQDNATVAIILQVIKSFETF